MPRWAALQSVTAAQAQRAGSTLLTGKSASHAPGADGAAAAAASAGSAATAGTLSMAAASQEGTGLGKPSPWRSVRCRKSFLGAARV